MTWKFVLTSLIQGTLRQPPESRHLDRVDEIVDSQPKVERRFNEVRRQTTPTVAKLETSSPEMIEITHSGDCIGCLAHHALPVGTVELECLPVEVVVDLDGGAHAVPSDPVFGSSPACIQPTIASVS